MTALDAPNADPLQATIYDFPRDFVGYGRQSLDLHWPNGAKIAVSFVINYEEGAERTVVNGDVISETHLWEHSATPARSGQRAVNIESDYEYGSRVGVWRLLNLFEEHEIPVTIYAVGQALEKNPEVTRAIMQNGHEIASHAYRWIDYYPMDENLEKAYIKRQLDCLKHLTGEFPAGWYYGRLSPRSKALVHEVYSAMNIPLLYESDSYADDVPYWVDVPAEKGSEEPLGMLMVPYTYDCNDMKYHVPAGWSTSSDFEEYLKNAFNTLYKEGCKGKPKMMTIGLHCRISGKPGRFTAVENFVEYIKTKSDVWVTTRKDIALHFRQMYPYRPGHLC